jgi:hypothetical protein
VTVIVELLVPLLAVIVPGAAVTVDCPALTPAGVTVTDAVCVTAVPLIVAETSLFPGPVELSVPVATPVVFVVVPGCVRVFPLPVAANTTVAPWIGLPNASRAMTVMVAVLAPLLAAIVVGAATTVDCPALTAAGVTVTVAVWVIPVPSIVAETTLSPAPVALSVPVATPPASVVAPGGVSVFPPPVAASTTVAPWIGFPKASRAVTVMVAISLPAVIDPGAAATVDCAALTPADSTVTVAVCVTPVPAIVAETTFSPVPVELIVPVATPLTLVGPRGCVRVFPAPLAASTTAAPSITLPN